MEDTHQRRTFTSPKGYIDQQEVSANMTEDIDD